MSSMRANAIRLTMIFLVMTFSSPALQVISQNRPEDQSFSSLIGLLREAHALTKNDQLRLLTKSNGSRDTRPIRQDQRS